MAAVADPAHRSLATCCLSCVQNLTSVGALSLTSNTALVSAAGLRNIATCAGAIAITVLPSFKVACPCMRPRFASCDLERQS